MSSFQSSQPVASSSSIPTISTNKSSISDHSSGIPSSGATHLKTIIHDTTVRNPININSTPAASLVDASRASTSQGAPAAEVVAEYPFTTADDALQQHATIYPQGAAAVTPPRAARQPFFGRFRSSRNLQSSTCNDNGMPRSAFDHDDLVTPDTNRAPRPTRKSLQHKKSFSNKFSGMMLRLRRSFNFGADNSDRAAHSDMQEPYSATDRLHENGLGGAPRSEFVV